MLNLRIQKKEKIIETSKSFEQKSNEYDVITQDESGK